MCVGPGYCSCRHSTICWTHNQGCNTKAATLSAERKSEEVMACVLNRLFLIEAQHNTLRHKTKAVIPRLPDHTEDAGTNVWHVPFAPSKGLYATCWVEDQHRLCAMAKWINSPHALKECVS